MTTVGEAVRVAVDAAGVPVEAGTVVGGAAAAVLCRDSCCGVVDMRMGLAGEAWQNAMRCKRLWVWGKHSKLLEPLKACGW